MRKKRKALSALIITFILVSFILSGIKIYALDTSSVSAKSAVLINAESGEVLFEKNADTRLAMASTTKIMTAIVAIENCDMSKTVSVSPLAVGVEGSSVYLFANEKISMEALLYSLMLSSANDAAAAIAIEVGGSIEAFAEMMNEKASELGLSNTHFTNPHGLYDDGHYTSAKDLAKLTSYALKNETFKKIVSTYKKSVPMSEGGETRLLVNHNKMLRIYDGAIGVKTGFTKKSGRCLVSAAERSGLTFIAVTINAPDDWNDHTKMLDFAFSSYESKVLASENEFSFNVPIISGTLPFVSCSNKAELSVCVPKENQNITHITELCRFKFASVSKGDILGKVLFYNNGKLIGQVELIADFDVPVVKYKKSFLGSLFG